MEIASVCDFLKVTDFFPESLGSRAKRCSCFEELQTDSIFSPQTTSKQLMATESEELHNPLNPKKSILYISTQK